ncbi:hypothetical protein AWJ20_1289 [Sugiyamaella lignohabitans]|uniref:Uncharacterized protein n=1 Tax=Sugiyamaella lignohabitans TaxID=796027 RepID=A0A167DKF6_9ASCO|nr:uncharacterized protein AWJ20_1289 [Sugiyamaella lignohabitans]ANB13011.1 hypothetical protein AWJ20_1289 [Sugiyamaella lignohabitans]
MSLAVEPNPSFEYPPSSENDGRVSHRQNKRDRRLQVSSLESEDHPLSDRDGEDESYNSNVTDKALEVDKNESNVSNGRIVLQTSPNYTHRQPQLSSSSTISSTSSSSSDLGEDLGATNHATSDTDLSLLDSSSSSRSSTVGPNNNNLTATPSGAGQNESNWSSKQRHSHRLSLSTISNSSLSATTPPGAVRKKRLSMNFAPLPVIASSGTAGNPSGTSVSSHISHHTSPTIQENRRKTTSMSMSSNALNASGSPKLKNSISTMGLGHAPKPQTSPQNETFAAFGANKNAGATALFVSPMDHYLSQLAAKERKVVELKDEIKRAQADLKRAELELKLFREGASQALAPPRVSADEERQRPSGPPLLVSHRFGPSGEPLNTSSQPNIASSASSNTGNKNQLQDSNLNSLAHNTGGSNYRTHAHSHSTSSSSSTQSQSNASQLKVPPTRRNRVSAMFSPDSTNHDGFDFDSYTPPAAASFQPSSSSVSERVSSTGSNGSYGACLDPDRSPPGKRASAQMQSIADLEWSSRPHFPPKDDVINMGKRVVEELGSQFWGLFEDIKNVTIGEEPREYPNQNDQYQRSSVQQNQTNGRRTNSYYIL